MKVFILFFSMLLLLPAVPAQAQFGISFQTYGGYASNVFANYRQLPDYYNALTAALCHDWIDSSSGLRLSYQGDMTLFDEYSYRNFHTHELGIKVYKYTNSTGNRLNAGVDIAKRLYNEDYRWYEYDQVYAYSNIKVILLHQLYGYAGGDFRVRKYSLLVPFSYRQSTWFLRLSRFFDTGTSVILEGNYFLKTYLNNNTVSLLPAFPELYTSGNGNNRQIAASLRLAQSIDSRTGVNAEILVRRTLNNSVRYLGTGDGLVYSDDDIFDDPYSYDSEQLNISLKRKFGWNIRMSTGLVFMDKHYTERLALDLNGYAFADSRLRHDKRSLIWISFDKSFRYIRALQPIILTVDLAWMQNFSNDPYYDYQKSYFSVGLSQRF